MTSLLDKWRLHIYGSHRKRFKMLQHQSSILSASTKGKENGVELQINSHDKLTQRDSALPPWDQDVSIVLKAVESKSLEKLKTLLEEGKNINGHGGAFLETPLHQAARDSWVEGVRYLVEQGACVCSKNQYFQTPLHYAAASKQSDCVKLMLSNANIKDVLDYQDRRGHTPLHDAAQVGCASSIQALVRAGASVKAFDKNCETPLHKAAKARSLPGMLILLNNGASLDAKDALGETVLSYTLRYFPSGMESLFDSCMSIEPTPVRKKSLEVVFNFLPLISSIEERPNQMKNLQSMVDLEQASLLSHTLCETFLLLKWQKVRKLFFIEIVFYAIYAILITLLTINKFVFKMKTEHDQLLDSVTEKVLLSIVFLQAISIALKQVVTAVQDYKSFFTSLWHNFNLFIAIFVFLVLVGNFKGQIHFATILLLVLWTQCMLLIGRFPNWGIYVVMFQRVAKVFLRIFFIYLCLLLAFTFSFYVSLHERRCDPDSEECDESGVVENVVFQDPASSFFKTLTMMIGELSFDEEFVKSLETVQVTSHLVFFAFVILVSIILANLLVALAVNDVQALRNSVHLERLIKQLELVYQMEENIRTVASIVMSINLPWRDFWKHDCEIVKVYMMPYDPNKNRKLCMRTGHSVKEVRIKKELLNDIMEHLRRGEMESKSSKSNTVSIRRSRRNMYKNSDDLKGNFQQLEANIMLQLNDKLGNMETCLSKITSSLVSLDKRLSTVETQIHSLSYSDSESESTNTDKFRRSLTRVSGFSSAQIRCSQRSSKRSNATVLSIDTENENGEEDKQSQA